MDIYTLGKEEIDKFLKRRRRIKFEENEFEGKLDLMLREILQKANEFVPSESGSILLDEPEKKSPFLDSRKKIILFDNTFFI